MLAYRVDIRMSMNVDSLPTADLHCAITLAHQAAALIREQAGRIERLTKRGGEEAVTVADRASQRLIVAGLKLHAPNDGVIGEESDSGEGITNTPPQSGDRIWVIDPIDGTNNFVSGLGCFAVCIGLLDKGEPILGVVHDVARDQTWWAQRGHGAWLDHERIQAARTPLSDSSLVMLTSNLIDTDGKLPTFVMRWFSSCPWKLRILGSAALEAVSVAGGISHAAITLNGKLWDIAAPAAIVLEAGGNVDTPRGGPLAPFTDLATYKGQKVPFVATAPLATEVVQAELKAHW